MICNKAPNCIVVHFGVKYLSTPVKQECSTTVNMLLQLQLAFIDNWAIATAKNWYYVKGGQIFIAYKELDGNK